MTNPNIHPVPPIQYCNIAVGIHLCSFENTPRAFLKVSDCNNEVNLEQK